MKPVKKDRRMNGRIKSVNVKKLLYMLDHNLRVKYSKHIQNSNSNFHYIPGLELEEFKYSNKRNEKAQVQKYKKDILEKLEKIQNQHKKFYLEQYGRNLREDRTNSIREGVLTFPRDMDNDLNNYDFDKSKFIELGIKTIENLCEKLGVELVCIDIHFDEKTPHFHYLISNFNNEGSILKITNEIGSLIQDLSRKYFQEYGILRGKKKELTGSKNIRNEVEKLRSEIEKSNEIIKSLNSVNKKYEKQNQVLQNQNKSLKKEVENLKSEKEELLNSVETLKKELNIRLKQIQDKKDEIVNLELDINLKKEIYKNYLNPLISDLRKYSKEINRKKFLKNENKEIETKVQEIWKKMESSSETVNALTNELERIEIFINELDTKEKIIELENLKKEFNPILE